MFVVHALTPTKKKRPTFSTFYAVIGTADLRARLKKYRPKGDASVYFHTDADGKL